MARVTVRSLETSSPEAEGVAVQAVIQGSGDPVHVHQYRVPAGARASWPNAGRGMIAYVYSGVVEVAGTLLRAGSIFTLEHNASAAAIAREDAHIVTFGVSEACSAGPEGDGGHLHILTAEAVPRLLAAFDGGKVGNALLADATCPTCSLWLHESILESDGEVPLHSHSEDEVILIIDGDMLIGNRLCGPGTVLAINRNTLYSLKAGKSGATFINFRPASPTYLPFDKSREPVDEAKYHLARMPHPVPITSLAPALVA
jgi:hypothetical protein